MAGQINRRTLLAGVGAMFLGMLSASVKSASFSPMMPRTAGITDLLYVPYKVLYVNGPYSAWANNWSMNWGGPFPWVEGVDFYAHWDVHSNAFPNRSTCTWFLPYGPPPNGVGVWGYYMLTYGNYDASASPTGVSPLQICNISTFTSDVDFTWDGDATWNMLHELFLTRDSRPTGGISENELLEIGFWLHANAGVVESRSWDDKWIDLGIHTNNGVDYVGTLAYGSTLADAYYAYFWNADTNYAIYSSHVTATIDWKAVMDFLLSKGIITGSEWVNGIAIGNEPGGTAEQAGTRNGAFTIDTWNMTFTGSTAAPGADYLGTNLIPDGDGMASWTLNALTSIPGQDDADGGTGAFLLSETTDNAIHYYTPSGGSITVPTEQHDFIWFEDIKTVGRDWIVMIISDGGSSQIVNRWNLSDNSSHPSGPNTGTGLETIQLQNDPSRSYYLTLECLTIGGDSSFHRVFWRFRKAAGVTNLVLKVGTALGTEADETAADYTFVGDVTKGLIVRPRHRLVQVV
jgi:hypothetical protein